MRTIWIEADAPEVGTTMPLSVYREHLERHGFENVIIVDKPTGEE